jgi:hypothetical protein
MTNHADHLERFLRAVHRRWVIVRVAEAMGIGVLGGCALALLVLPILLWRGEPAMTVVLMTAGLAALAGTIAGIIRRPDLMSAAVEADRQLDLADLLSTALTTRQRSADDPWAALVVATAGARCRTLAPNAVIVNRLGGRAWGGIGLATALVLTLGLMSTEPGQSVAVARVGDEHRVSDDSAPSLLKSASPRNVSEAQARPRSANDGVNERTERDGSADLTSSGATNQTSRVASATSDGGGAGTATSARESRQSDTPQRSAKASRDAREGEAAAGGATSAASDPGGEGSAGSTVMSSPSAPAPVWRSSEWREAREQALSAVRDGKVRDEHRDLVREYFDRTSD